ncbi:MAG: hypothetical protein JWQ11_913 [Rhizobacter sp.]|nr:hypothetical protein [Rhizobacter sp.]
MSTDTVALSLHALGEGLRARRKALRLMLANSDRWADDSAFSRDIIDLAMMSLKLGLLRQAVVKAEEAYGSSVLRDLGKAVDGIRNRQGRLERCMQAMAMTLPKAVLWGRIRALERVLPKSA